VRNPRLAFLLLTAWFLLAATSALGQHLEVFNIEDFVDPSLLDLLSTKEEARAFGALTLVTGAGRDLQRWGESAEGDFHFAHLAGDLYMGRWQLGLDAISLNSQEAGPRFGDRLGIQVGHYSTSATLVEVDEKNQRQLLVRYVTRTLFLWQVERRPGGDLGHSFTLGLDLRRDGPRTSVVDVVGGYTYTWVQAGEGDNGHDRHYLSFDYRSPIAAYKNGIRLLTGFGIGAENTLGHFRWGAARFELAAEIPIRPIQSKVRLSWAPSYQLDRGEFHHELAVLFLPPVASRVFSRSR
jgi:hypothetical protein